MRLKAHEIKSKNKEILWKKYSLLNSWGWGCSFS